MIIAVGPVVPDVHCRAVRQIPGVLQIIFCAIWGEFQTSQGAAFHFTGVLAQLHPEGTLNAALRLLPSTKHVVVVGGVGKFDEGFEAIAKQSFLQLRIEVGIHISFRLDHARTA